MERSYNSALFYWLLALVILAPLPFGSQRPWAWSLLATATGLLLAIWGVAVLRGRARAPVPIDRLWPPAAAFLVVLAWAMLQTANSGWLGLQHPIWDEAAATVGQAAWMGGRSPISLDPTAGWSAILKLAAYGGIFWLSVQLGRDRLRARQALIAVTAASVAYAAYGLAAYFSGSNTILWIDKWAYVGDVTGTFVNRNAFGAYAGIGFVCCLTLATHGMRPRGDRGVKDLAEDLLIRAAPFIVGGLVVGSALLLSHSRGALAATLLAVVCLVGCFALGRLLQPRSALLALVLVAAFGIAGALLSGEATMLRILTARDESIDRESLYRVVMHAIGDAPWTGFGLGSFPAVFDVYRDGTLLAPISFRFAHSVHLELVLELGWPGAIIFYFAIVWIVGVCVAGLFRRQRDQIYPAVAIAASVLLGAHGVIDFSVQIPANAALLALLLGIGYAQSWSTGGHRALEGRGEGPTTP